MFAIRFFLLPVLLLWAAVFSLDASQAPAGWTVLENCRLVQSDYADGDSFHVTQLGRNHHFRLYFVDCPETDLRFPERIRDQMKAFGLDEKGVVAAGQQAHEFTSRMLARPFTVLTKWQDARGDSKQERFYAVVLIDNKNLAEELVRSGFARAFGMHADFPSEAGSRQFMAKLRRLQSEAIRLRVGAFSHSAAVPPVANNRNASDADSQGAMPERILDEGLRSIEVDFK